MSRTPAINPAFAIVESFWILAGRNDAKLVNFWNPALPRFSGTGDQYPGAYGHRLRHRYEIDQIEAAFEALSTAPHGRQVVLQIWDPRIDTPRGGNPATPDVPCNICSLLKVRDGRLEWLQLLRSNDLFRGLPYNIVQFTMLQEILAGWLGLEPGSYNHVADSLHVYEADLDEFRVVASESRAAIGSANLALPKRDFERTHASFMDALDRLASPDLTRGEFDGLCRASGLPRSYHDMLLVTAADSARRRGWQVEQQRAQESCTDAPLLQTWMAWAGKRR